MAGLIIGTAFGIDIVSIVVSGLISAIIYQALGGPAVSPSVFFGASLLVAVVFSLLARGRGLYELNNLLALDRQLKWVTALWALSFGLLLVIGFLLKASSDLSRGAMLVFFSAGLLVLVVHRISWTLGLSRALARGKLARRRVAVLAYGAERSLSGYSEVLNRGGYEVVERFSIGDDDLRDGGLARLCATVRGSTIDEILLSLPASALGRLDSILEGLRALPLPVRLLPDVALSRIVLQPSRHLGPFALVDLQREPLSRLELAFKRTLDIAVAGAALVALAPLLGLAMLAVKLDTPGPVLFRQTRRGFNGRDFKILKLRSMSVMEDGAGITQATRSDPRVTRVGFWLRRTSIDELPQLWNVLRGEMSVVGPRPHAVAHDKFYDPLIEKYAFRHHVKPGLTGWAQVRGLRGETPEVSMMAARIDHDLWYINNWTPFLDVRILMLTCVKLFAKTAY